VIDGTDAAAATAGDGRSLRRRLDRNNTSRHTDWNQERDREKGDEDGTWGEGASREVAIVAWGGDSTGTTPVDTPTETRRGIGRREMRTGHGERVRVERSREPSAVGWRVWNIRPFATSRGDRIVVLSDDVWGGAPLSLSSVR
jgi:hypothetical protein